MAAATVLRTCTQVGICVGCWAPLRFARGQARGFLREEVTVSISQGLPFGDTNPHARGYGCARETLCAARRGEGARARETLCACHGRRSRIAGGFHELWATPVVVSTCDGRVYRGPRTSGDALTVAFCRVEAPSIKSCASRSLTGTYVSVKNVPILLLYIYNKYIYIYNINR